MTTLSKMPWALSSATNCCKASFTSPNLGPTQRFSAFRIGQKMDGLTKQPAKGVFWKILTRSSTTLMSMYININILPVNIYIYLYIYIYMYVYTSKYIYVYIIYLCACMRLRFKFQWSSYPLKMHVPDDSQNRINTLSTSCRTIDFCGKSIGEK